MARQFVLWVRSSNLAAEFRRRVIQFIETVILYQFPKMSREEIERMLLVNDVRETREFQEGREQAILDIAT